MTKIVMIVSAIFLVELGLAGQFFPSEILLNFGIKVSVITKLVLQLSGALYLGFAFLNWMAKDNIIGGVYSRPVAIGNLSHFTIGAITLIKLWITGQAETVIIVLAILYLIFAMVFAKIVFTHPIKEEK